jgi:L-lactate dehydrogenase complex protein LldG
VTLPALAAVDRAGLAERFARELQAVGGGFRRAAAGDLVHIVQTVMNEQGADSLLAWDQGNLPVPGLWPALEASGVRLVNESVPPDEPARSEALARLELCRVGLTGADAAFAETGTIALRSGPGRPRLASL